MFALTMHGRRAQNEAMCCGTIENRPHLVNKPRPVRSCESERSASYTYKNRRILVRWMPSRLLTATAHSKSLIRPSLLSREIPSEPEPAMDR